jgi:glycerol 3-phosphatase-2
MTAIVCDLDGVVWRGDDPIPGSAAAIGELREAGYRVGFVTNNSAVTPDVVLAKL